MPAKASLGISIPVNDEGLDKLIEGIKTLIGMAGGSLPESFAAAQQKVTNDLSKIAAKAQQVATETAQKAELIEKASAAKINEIKAAAAVKEESRQKASAEKKEQTQAKQAASESSRASAKAAKDAQAQSVKESRAQQAQQKAEASANAKAQKDSERINAQVKSEQEATQKKAGAEDAAAKRRIEAENRAAALTKSAENMTTDALVDDIFKLQQKREFANNARKQAASEGSKFEVAEQGKVIASLDEEIATLKKVSIQREEVQKHGAGTKIGQLGTGREANEGSHKGGINIAEIAGIAGAAEGLSVLVEKSKEVTAAEHQLTVGTGLAGDALKKAGEDAEAIGDKLGVSGDEAQTTMGKVASYTHATGDELKKQTEAVVAYAQAHGKSSEMVAKQLSTASGQATIFAEATDNISKAQEAAKDPAIQAELAQEKVEETTGKLAQTLLTGLAPILTDVGPLIGTVGEVLGSVLGPAMKVVQFLLTPLITGLNFLKPILPELVIGIGALVIAFNAQAIATGILNAVMAVNPFVWVGIAIVALIGIVVLLVKHWDDVIATIKKVFSAITDAGGAVLDFLGITSKADAATKKHTDSLKENKKSLEEIKAATEEATKASNDYTDALEKNADEADKDSKQRQDNAIAAIRDINEKLSDPAKRLAGDTEESLKKTRELWIQHGKQAVADAKKLKEETDAASGTFIPDEASGKAKPSAAAKKAAKDKFTVLREAADDELELQKDSIIESGKTGAEAKAAEMAAEIVHQQAMLDIAEQQYGKASAQFRSAHAKLKQDRQALAEDTKNELIEEGKRNTETELSELDTRAIKENLTEKQVSEQRFQIVQQGLKDEIAYRKSWGEDVSKLQAQLDQGELKHADELAKARKKIAEDIGKENLDTQRQYLDLERQQLQASGKSTEEIDAQLNRLDQDAEDKRYADELASRKDDLADVQMGHALKESLDANHQGKLSAIQKKGYDAQLAADKEKISWLTGPLSNAFAKTGDAINQKFFTPMLEKALGGKNIFSGFISDIVGGLIKTGVTIATQFATNLALQAAFGTASVATATATNAGILATAAPAAAAESVATLGIAPTVGSTALLTSMASVVPALLSFIPHEDGAVFTSPAFTSYGGRFHSIAESGHEAAIPLQNSKYPGFAEMAAGGFGAKLDTLNRTMTNVHSAVLNAPQPILPVNTPFEQTRNRNNFRTNLISR